ncbi:MAG: beta-galactosidase [Sedimentisphaerales bacterium]|nr:beta-galactosidase [Sedimentisphaerales bacterium]
MIGLASCNATEKHNVPQWQQNLISTIPYKIKEAQNLSVQSVEGRHILQAKDGFRLVLVPVQDDVWRFVGMESVSVLGLMFKNTGNTEMILDMMLGNEGATGWSNSSLGRTVVKTGEEMPLAVALGRRSVWEEKPPHPAYLRMSGLPDGHFSHWHTIDPKRVKDLVITCNQKGEHSFELAQMFPLQKMDESQMGKFPFIDKYGQYIQKEWPNKVHSDKDLLKGIAIEKKLEEEYSEPTGFTKYGGFKEGPKFEATGFFRVERYKDRWWFVDPEGYLFWSYGADCIGIQFAGQTPLEREPSVFQGFPAKDDKKFGQFYIKLDVEHNYALLEDVPHYDFTAANLYRKYGRDWAEKTVEQDIKRLKYCHLNTIGAWSDYEIAAQKKVPYTVMLHYVYAFAAPKMPDPFDPETRAGLRKAMREYPVPFKDDPWCLGAFVNNELHWENRATELVPAILGYDQRNAAVKKETTEVKKVFRDWFKEKYTTIEAFNNAWKTSFTTWDDLLKVTDVSVFRNANSDDCSALATLFADAFYKMVKEELKNYSPNILYLGSRFHVAPPEVIKTAAKYADVISANIYSYSPYVGRYGVTDKPVLITEFHFVNTAGSNLGGGLRSAQDAVQQGRLLRAYIAEAVNNPQIIGAHWFQWRDQNVGGRYDGENYDVGFFDIVDMPNEELVRAAEESGRNLYNCIK